MPQGCLERGCCCLGHSCPLLSRCGDRDPAVEAQLVRKVLRELQKTGLGGHSQGWRGAELGLTSPWSGREGRRAAVCGNGHGPLCGLFHLNPSTPTAPGLFCCKNGWFECIVTPLGNWGETPCKGSCPPIWDTLSGSRAEQLVLDLSRDLSRPAGVSVPYSLYIAAVFSF